MDKKKKYISPIIERFAIDKSISLVMQSPGGQDEGWDIIDDPPVVVGGSGKTFSGSKIERTESSNTFEQNPFK